MPQSLAKVYVHIVFTTKHGKRLIKEEYRKELQSYIIGTLSNSGSYTPEIYSNPDHIHILCTLPRTITIAELISLIKTSSSRWLKTKGLTNFGWQDGYAVFSVSASNIPSVVKYIQEQSIHHVKNSYQNELRIFFKEYEIEFDERYVWD